jgi:integrase
MKFTDKFLLHQKPKKDKMYQIRETDGFGIRVLPSGLTIFIFIYTIAGKRRQMNLGDYPDVTLAKARGRLLEVKTALKDGKDPQEVGFEWHKNPERERREAIKLEEEERKNPTVSQLANEYMEKHAKVMKRQSSWKEDERLLDKDVLPVWGQRKANEIKKRDCVLLLESFVDRPALCNNILKLTRKMFNFAVERDILEYTPFTGIKSPAPVIERERHLSDDEVRALWTTELPKASMSDEVKRILQLILCTAQRSDEVAGMHRREIDGHWWTIPSERTKNGRTNRVYLTQMALSLIGDADGYIFPSPTGRGHIDKNAVAYAIRRNLKDYKSRRPITGETVKMVKVKEERKMAMEHFTPHDLRRTANTLMASIRVPFEHRERVLNHAREKLDRIYNLYGYDDEKQIALEALERKLLNIITGANKVNVVSITTAKMRIKAA